MLYRESHCDRGIALQMLELNRPASIASIKQLKISHKLKNSGGLILPNIILCYNLSGPINGSDNWRVLMRAPSLIHSILVPSHREGI